MDMVHPLRSSGVGIPAAKTLDTFLLTCISFSLEVRRIKMPICCYHLVAESTLTHSSRSNRLSRIGHLVAPLKTSRRKKGGGIAGMRLSHHCDARIRKHKWFFAGGERVLNTRLATVQLSDCSLCRLPSPWP